VSRSLLADGLVSQRSAGELLHPSLPDSIVLDTNSVSGSQSELSKLNSAQFDDLKLNKESNALSSTKATPTNKKRKL